MYPPLLMALSTTPMLQAALVQHLTGGGTAAAEALLGAIDRAGAANGIQGAQAAFFSLLNGPNNGCMASGGMGGMGGGMGHGRGQGMGQGMGPGMGPGMGMHAGALDPRRR